MLVSAEQAFQQLEDSKTQFFDVRFALPGPNFDPGYGLSLYNQGHIPGALYADLECELTGKITAVTGRHPLPSTRGFTEKLQSWGLTPEKNIIVYDDKGGMLATRFWWMLRYWAGHENIVILDGGFPAWVAAKLPVDNAEVQVQPSTHRYHLKACKIAYPQEVEEIVSGLEQAVLLDARAENRFKGLDETVDPVAGHIPGAANRPCSENLDAEGRFLPPEDLKRQFLELLGEAPAPERVVHYCGSGVTACHNIFAMDLAGLAGSRLYPGSWSEWIRGSGHPVATQ